MSEQTCADVSDYVWTTSSWPSITTVTSLHTIMYHKYVQLVYTQALSVSATVQGHSGLWRISNCWDGYGCDWRENYIIGYTSE